MVDRIQGGSGQINIIPQILVDLVVEHCRTVFKTDLGVLTTEVLSAVVTSFA